VNRDQAEQRRRFDPDMPPADRAKNRSLFFDDLLDARAREFKPRCFGTKGRRARAIPPSAHRHLRQLGRVH